MYERRMRNMFTTKDGHCIRIHFSSHALIRSEERCITQASVECDINDVAEQIDKLSDGTKFSVVNGAMYRNSVCCKGKDRNTTTVEIITIIDCVDPNLGGCEAVFYAQNAHPSAMKGDGIMKFDDLLKSIKVQEAQGRKWPALAAAHSVSETLCVAITEPKVLRLGSQAQEQRLVFEMFDLGADDKQIIRLLSIKKPIVAKYRKEYYKTKAIADPKSTFESMASPMPVYVPTPGKMTREKFMAAIPDDRDNPAFKHIFDADKKEMKEASSAAPAPETPVQKTGLEALSELGEQLKAQEEEKTKRIESRLASTGFLQISGDRYQGMDPVMGLIRNDVIAHRNAMQRDLEKAKEEKLDYKSVEPEPVANVIPATEPEPKIEEEKVETNMENQVQRQQTLETNFTQGAPKLFIDPRKAEAVFAIVGGILKRKYTIWEIEEFLGEEA